jgi:transcriptional regulator NrdR family protein
MVCLYCQHETQVVNSRLQKRNNKVWRRRKCLHCLAIFTTIEEVDYSNALRVEANGTFKPFLTDLLYTEVLLALEHRKAAYIDAREVTNTIIKNLVALPASPLFGPQDISRTAADVLKRFDTRAWHRYAAEHPSLS